MWCCFVVVDTHLQTYTPTHTLMHSCSCQHPPTHQPARWWRRLPACLAPTLVGVSCRLQYTYKTSLTCTPSLLHPFVVIFELFEFCYWAGLGVGYTPTPTQWATLPFVAFLRGQITLSDIFARCEHVGLKKCNSHCPHAKQVYVTRQRGRYATLPPANPLPLCQSRVEAV